MLAGLEGDRGRAAEDKELAVVVVLGVRGGQEGTKKPGRHRQIKPATKILVADGQQHFEEGFFTHWKNKRLRYQSRLQREETGA